MQIINRKSDKDRDVNDVFVDNFYRLSLQHIQPKSVVQIGAYDGITDDELYPYLSSNKDVNAWLVEPLLPYFQKICELHQSRENIIPIHVAIGEKKECTSIYHIDPNCDDPELPRWAKGCSTIAANRGPLFGFNCTTEEYEVLKRNMQVGFTDVKPLQMILDEFEINEIDLFHIDAEGYDWRIIRQLNFDKYKPLIIHYEQFNMSDNDRIDCQFLLETFGYKLYTYRHNVTCIRSDIETLQIEKELRSL